MKLRSLRVFLPLALLVIMLLTGGASVGLSLHQRQRNLTEDARLSVLSDVSRLVRLTSEGMGSTSALVASEVAQIASRPQADVVLLIDDQGTVLNAHRTAWRGRQIKELLPAAVGERLQQAARSRMPVWHMQADGNRIDAVQSFELPQQSDELRSTRRGLAYVAYDLRERRSAATRSEVQARLPELVGLLSMFLLMAWWLGRHVTAPLARLDAAADALRNSDLTVPVPRGGFMEIDQLAGGLEALRQELSATWHAIPDLLFELNAEGRYLRVLAVRPELVVQAPKSLLGRTVHDVMPADAAQVVQQALHDATTAGAVWGRELSLQVPAGRRWFEISVACKTSPDQSSPTFLLISRDVTERKEASESLRQLNEALEQRVQQRTAELLGAKNEAERANHSKSEFLSRMSHELRTPLNAILGFGQLLEISAQEPKQQRQVGHILSAGKHLLSLINEILDLSRVESGQMTLSLEPVPLTELVEESLSLVRPLAEAHGVRLAPPPALHRGCHVRADRTRLRQVLINLLSNGIKYNRPGGDLTVHIDLLPHSQAGTSGPDTVRLRVQDAGMGLTLEQQARLFTPFERLDADDRHIEGTGIGLALSKRLVDLMGGQIGVESQLGQGSTFWISLTHCEGSATQSATEPSLEHTEPSRAPASADHLPDCTILCIEDNELNLQLIDHLLGRRPGMHLLCANTPLQGLRMAHELRPHIILLDIHLPDMDGYEVIARLRADPDTAAIPVLAVTAHAMPGDAARVRTAGFAGYITKPINVATLLAEVERLRPRAYDPHTDSAPANP